MKKNLFVILVLALAMTGCQGEVGCTRSAHFGAEAEADVDDDDSVAEAVAQRLEFIYQNVYKVYNQIDSLRNHGEEAGEDIYGSLEDFAPRYCSNQWNSLLRQVDEIDTQYHANEMGFWDFDYWIMGQDWGKLSISDIVVKDCTDDEATVQYKLHNLDSAKTIIAEFVNEDGVWKIDNLLDIDDDVDIKASMEEYVKEENAKNGK